MRRSLGIAVAVVAAAALCVPGAARAETQWRTTIYEPDGTPLDTWVFRPDGLGPTDRTPVVVSVTQTLRTNDVLALDPFGVLDPHESTDDGMTHVLVSASGFGASGGCADWGGSRDRAAVRTAVEWAADQQWSTGDVGLIGSSYDGMTAAEGLVHPPPRGLRAIVDIHGASGYNEIFSYRVRNMISGHALPLAIGVGNDLLPASFVETPERQLRGPLTTARRPTCPVMTATLPLHEDPNSAFWRDRDIAPRARGSTIPTLYAQGFIDWNVRATAFTPIWRALAGPKRAILGPWTHAMYSDGEVTFSDDIRNWFARYLKHEAVPDMPPVVVSDQDGLARAETSWPPADATMRAMTLRPGTYLDMPFNAGEHDPPDTVRDTIPLPLAGLIPNGRGIWTFSPRLPYEARMSGDPTVTATVRSLVPGVHLVVLVYDVEPDGTATLVTRGAFKVPASGSHSFELYPTDWRFDPGHRIGVLLTSADDWWFEPGLTFTPVDVDSAVLEAPFLTRTRTADESPRYRSNPRPGPIQVDPATFSGATSVDPLPPPMT
jgi:uncharacterized protein